MAGKLVCGDWPLIRSLTTRHQVTLVERVNALSGSSLIDTARVLVIDCSEGIAAVLDLLPALKREHPSLRILLINGGLSQRQIAVAFREGIQDYFSDPYDSELLAARVGYLTRRQGPREAGA